MCDYGYVSDLLGDPVDNAAGSASAQANDSEAYQNSGAYQSDEDVYANAADINDYSNYGYDEYADAYAQEYAPSSVPTEGYAPAEGYVPEENSNPTAANSAADYPDVTYPTVSSPRTVSYTHL
mgnify:FL=1